MLDLNRYLTMTEKESAELEQLRRTAEMFEMILQATPGAIENYENLKEIYWKLNRPDKVKNVILRLAEQYALAQDMRAARIELKNALKYFPNDPIIRSKMTEYGYASNEVDVAQLMHEYEALCMKCEEINSRCLIIEKDIENIRSVTDGLHEDYGSRLRIKELEAEHTKTAEELVQARKRKSEVENRLSNAIGTLPDAERERAQAEFKALSGEMEIVPLDKTNSRERTELKPTLVKTNEAEKIQEHKPRDTKHGEAVSIAIQQTISSQTQKKDERALERSKKFGRLLVDGGVISEKNLEEALKIQQTTGKTLGKVLLDMGVASDSAMLNCIAVKTGLPYLPLKSYEINTKAVKIITGEVARKYGIVPVDLISKTLLIVMANPLDVAMQKELEKQVGMKISYYLSSPMEIEEALNQFYPA